MKQATIDQINRDEIRRRAIKFMWTRLFVGILVGLPIIKGAQYVAGEVCAVVTIILLSVVLMIITMPAFVDAIHPEGY